MHKEYRFRSIKCQRYFTVNENGATSELSVRSSLSFLLGMSMPELWIDPWSISWLWEKSCISLSVTYQTQIGFWCRVFRFVLILMLYSHISCFNAFIYSFVSWKNEKWAIKQEKWISHLFGRQRPRWFVWLFTEMCMVHVGSHWGDSACAQLVLVLVSKPRVYIFTHKALHWLHHVLKVLGVGCWVALQVYLNLQKERLNATDTRGNIRSSQ